MEEPYIFIFTVISAIADGCAFIFNLILLSILIYRIIQAKYNRTPNIIDVPLVLSINILCIVMIKIIIQTIHITYPLLKKDLLYESDSTDHFFCYFRAYILWTTIGILYWNCTLLTFFRFARVFYPHRKYLQRLSFYLYILIPLITLIMQLIILPLLFVSNPIEFISYRFSCDITLKPYYHILYVGIIIFFLPYTTICILYFRIASLLQHSSTTLRVGEHQRRDCIVIKRILINTIILGIVSTPSIILIILYNIDDRFEELTYSTIWLSSSIAALLFTSVLPFITTQLRQLVKGNEIIPVIET